MTRNIFQQHPDNIAIPLPITLGGTGHKTAPQALNALDGISVDQVGAAYLYKQESDGTFSFVHKYVASDHYRNQCFGYGLAMNGDCTEIIVGSPYVFWSSSGNENGSVYVFR